MKLPHSSGFSTTLSISLENLSKSGRINKQAVSVGADAVIAVFALWAAYSLRLGLFFSDFRSTWYLFLLIPLAAVVFCMALGVYRWVVRSSNSSLFGQLVKATFLTSFALLVIVALLPPERTNPRSLFVIFGMLQLLGMGGARLVWQSFFDAGNQGQPVAIYGAGSSGRQLADSLSIGQEFRPVLFIEDSASLIDTTVSGLPVVSGADLDSLKSKIAAFEVERVIMAMPSVSKKRYKALLSHVENLNLPVQTVPSVTEIITGTKAVDSLQDISIKDILGRREIAPDAIAVEKCVKGKTVLVTGGGGSIGSELCRQIHQLGATRLIAFDHSEENLYHLTEELTRVSGQLGKKGIEHSEFVPVLGSVKDIDLVRRVIVNHNVDTIYHAAAYKHVPIVERQPRQGVETNIIGTMNVLDAAIESGVSSFTLISTDKAVRPTNVMGATKRVAELVLQAKAREQHQTKISMVRFGNVLGSSGSVVPKFKEQIIQGGPITITHPEITRYFMTIPEAAQLVLQSSAIARGGDVFVLDMGEAVKIVDLAKSMVALSGAKLKEDTGNPADIDIVFEGLRPGEKMFEELFITENRPTSIEKVFSAEESFLDWVTLKEQLDSLNKLVGNNDDAGTRELLLSLAFTGSDVQGAGQDFNVPAAAK